jgi:CubicO group peptidase (beta-lactamase class C family)
MKMNALTHPTFWQCAIARMVIVPAVVATTLSVIGFLIQGSLYADSPSTPVPKTEVHHLDPETQSLIDREVTTAIENKLLPGAVVAIGYQGHVVFHRAYGNRQLLPSVETMTLDTVFDLASLTKPIVTACCVMKLVEEGKLSLDDPVASHLPEFVANGKESVRVKQLLLHTAGLIPDNSMKDYAEGRDIAIQKVMQLTFNYQPNERFRYSDVGFIVLGELVERLTGKSLSEYATESFFGPLEMHETCFRPSPSLQVRTATTEQRAGHWIKGDVHDPRCFAMGGIAGHAGLFSTASDIAIFSQALLNGGELNGQRVLDSETVKTMTDAYQVPGGVRGLGWDKRSAYSTNRGESMTPSAFGHGGFTGTGLWIDPELHLFVVFLSNRVHPDGKGSVNALIGRIGTIAADMAIAAKQAK